LLLVLVLPPRPFLPPLLPVPRPRPIPTALLFIIAVVAASACVAAASPATLAVAPLFTDHAVLQRDRPVPIWGTAEPDAHITVSFGDQTHTTTTDDTGHWRLTLDALSATTIG